MLVELLVDETRGCIGLEPCVAVVELETAELDVAATRLSTDKIDGQSVTYGCVIARSV